MVAFFRSLSIVALVAIGFATLPGSAQSTIPEATQAARLQQKQKQVQQIRPENYDLRRYPVNDSTVKRWRSLLWTTALVQPQEPYVATTLSQIVALSTQRSLSSGQESTIEMALQVGTQLLLSNPSFYTPIGQQFQQTIARSPEPEWVAMALAALARVSSPEQVQAWSAQVKSRFPNWQQDVHLYSTLRDLELSAARLTPPLSDLLNWTIAPNQLHLYVVCQSDRWVLCRAILKDRQGQFVRRPTGELWSVPLMLRSLHGLNWNFSRGQTPQGIYRMEQVVTQDDREFFRAFGQFSLVQLFVPFESGAKEFLPGKRGNFRGTLKDYQALLPESWRSYWPIQQSYWAGKAGRGLFRIHGSGEGLDFFPGKTQNPDTYAWNPTIGCLSALEVYDNSGQLQQADMPEILSRLTATGGRNFTGYVVVVEMPSMNRQPIDLNALEAAIRS